MTISKCKFMCTHKNTHESAIFEKKKSSNLVGKRRLLYTAYSIFRNNFPSRNANTNTLTINFSSTGLDKGIINGTLVVWYPAPAWQCSRSIWTIFSGTQCSSWRWCCARLGVGVSDPGPFQFSLFWDSVIQVWRARSAKLNRLLYESRILYERKNAVWRLQSWKS